ncbi:hypothetical protein WJX74_007711 [Apatococcus lobatus]|uniref:HNH nuclease domain-containing protein n=1 Tax=Apatococcus lobatus TaxID=904363 RepID=A0AAW1RB90_9CHLO
MQLHNWAQDSQSSASCTRPIHQVSLTCGSPLKRTGKSFWSSVAYKGATSMADPIKEAQGLLLADLTKCKADRDEDLIKELKEFLMLTQTSAPSEQAETLDKLGALVPFLQAMVCKITLSPDSSSHGSKRKAQQQHFKLALYNYYSGNREVLHLPTEIECMVTQLTLPAHVVTAAHLFPQGSPEVAAMAFNVPDVYHPRNGLLWADPIEKAWSRHEIAFIADKTTGRLKFRVLTDALMTTKLMDYHTKQNPGESFRMRQFSFYDGHTSIQNEGRSGDFLAT